MNNKELQSAIDYYRQQYGYNKVLDNVKLTKFYEIALGLTKKKIKFSWKIARK